MSNSTTARTTSLQRSLSIIAMLFGFITVLAGIAVGSGSNPGYSVFKPLLFFNTLMGVAYVFTGWTIQRNIPLGGKLSFIIFAVNLLVFIIVVYLAVFQSAVAVQSVAAMALRTTVWLAIFWGVVKIVRVN